MVTVDEFVKDYLKTKNEKQKEFIEKHIVKKYIEYETKCKECKKIVESTSYKIIENKKIFELNTPIKYMLFDLLIVSLYTDINFDISNSLEVYNKLSEYNIINFIKICIPPYEYEKFVDILNMVSDDYIENNRNLVSFIENKLNEYSDFATMALSTIERLTNERESI